MREVNTKKRTSAQKKKKVGGRPSHRPTEANRKQVKAFAGYGVTTAQIASLMGIAENTLRKYYADDIETGRAHAVAAVAQSVYAKATSRDVFDAKGKQTASEHPRALDAAKFFLKTVAGWKETEGREHTGPNGGPMQTLDLSQVADMTDEELEALGSALEKLGQTAGR